MRMPVGDHALEESRSFVIRPVPLLHTVGWLVRGWRDLKRCPIPGLLHGLVLALFGATLFWLARDQFWLLAGAFSAFLLVAPITVTGLYAISRHLARGEPDPGLIDVLEAWHPRDTRMVRFGLLLALAGAGWVFTSAALINALWPDQVNTPADFIRLMVLGDSIIPLYLWLGFGAFTAAPVFASSVVAIPLMLDRHISLWGAVLTSWRAVMAHPGPMALWAVLLLVLTGIGMATAMIGLVVITPWLAHASWHAYQDLVDCSGWVERP